MGPGILLLILVIVGFGFGKVPELLASVRQGFRDVHDSVGGGPRLRF